MQMEVEQTALKRPDVLLKSVVVEHHALFCAPQVRGDRAHQVTHIHVRAHRGVIDPVDKVRKGTHITGPSGLEGDGDCALAGKITQATVQISQIAQRVFVSPG